MTSLFSQLFEASKSEGKLIAIYTDKDDPSRFTAGYIQEHDDSMVYLKCIDRNGYDDGYIYFKADEIYEVEYKSRYLNRKELLIRKQSELITPPCIPERQQGENYLINLIKQAMADHLIISIDRIYDHLHTLIGYVKDIDDRYLQVQVITDEGDDDGISAIRIEDIKQVDIAGIYEIKAEVLYKNRSLL